LRVYICGKPSSSVVCSVSAWIVGAGCAEGQKLAGDLYAALRVGVDVRKQGNLREAHTLFRRALELSRRAYGEEHPNTAMVLDNLTNLLLEQGAYDEARQLHERILGDRERVLGEEHSVTAQSLNHLGNVLSELGMFSEARHRYERALAIFKAEYGDHPKTAMVLYNLATVLSEQGMHDEASSYEQRALGILEATDKA
jgi:eukaryotic-like serine/threonine-protein kinase